MGRWTQCNEDSTRLPEGVTRIGYDADTARYSFCDREGNLYLGPPHEDYGSLTLVGKTSHQLSATDDRPQAFSPHNDFTVEIQVSPQGSTFHDILPSHLIVSPSSADSTLSSPTATSRLRGAVLRSAALPSMANVVNSVRRSTTMLRRNRAKDNEKNDLLRSPSQASSTTLARSNSSSTTIASSVMDEKIKLVD
ncbi:hypothetical protein R3P38DRAFT_2889329 [Favolaschia claudopus]|uniref:Uncharacterized protein n=1 Tax=Favolaschia claudopus TaxID=2862362 RepID=A0AAW0CU49_9AGAR